MRRAEFDVDKYYERYFKGDNPKALAKEIGVHYATLINRFNEKGYPLLRSKSISLNHNYFNKINTYKKAYFLGLLLADGCINNNRILIYLQERDRHILETFKKEINYSGKLRLIKKRKEHHQNQISLEFSSSIMKKDLKKLNCIERKSNILSNFPKIQNKFKSSFILGYFDGDGTVGIDKRSNAPVFSIVGNKEFLEDIREELDKKIFRKANAISRCHLKGKSTLDYKSKRSFFELHNYLYKNCNIFLFRKKKKFELILNELNTSNNRNKKIRQYDLNDNFIKEFNNINEVKNKFNLNSVDKIYKCIKGINNSSMGYKWKTVNYECK